MTDADRATHSSTPDRSEGNAINRDNERIRSLLEEMTGRPLPQGVAGYVLGIPIIPDFESLGPRGSYAEMRKRADIIKKSIDSLQAAFDALSELRSIIPTVETMDSLEPVDQSEGISFLNIVKLHGPYRASWTSILCLMFRLIKEHREIDEEIRVFYGHKKRGKKKNSQAYLVAERLARFYLVAVKDRPTYGNDAGVPSTRYQRCLEDLFCVLGIRAGTHGPASAACQGITDEDVKQAGHEFIALDHPLNI